MTNQPIHRSIIRGWGVDADPRNNPTYPMREISQDDKAGMNWSRPALQTSSVEVLHSNERPNLTAVFGTSTPPAALSGAIRRHAFKRSEGKWGHWLLLLMADRINVVEGIFQDLSRGRLPHIFAEMGVRAEIKHNFPGFMRKTVIAALIVFALVFGTLLALWD